MISKTCMNPSFAGKYQLNANQEMKDQDTCLKRDALMGFWSTKAKDGDKIAQQMKDFYTGDYEKDKGAKLDIVLEIPDDQDAYFEKSMQAVGQNFSKIA